MAPFFICKEQNRARLEKVRNHFIDKGLNSIEDISHKGWLILNVARKLIPDHEQYTFENTRVLVSGTMVYKGLGIKESGEQLAIDIAQSKLDFQTLLGEYTLIHLHNDGIEILSAPSGIANVFYVEDNFAVSSSMLALKCFIDGSKVNKEAALETLLTGTLIGSETIYQGISKLTPTRPFKSENLTAKVLPRRPHHGYFRGSKEEAVEYQIEVLGKYFQQLKPAADELGVDSGLTSGFDSRLMLALMRRHWNNFQIHGHYREKTDKELEISTRLSEVAGLSMGKVPVVNPLSKTPGELQAQFMDAYQFCDGLVRMHGYWNEEYNTAEHRKSVLNVMKLGVSGIGGEQYRNSDNLVFSHYGLSDFVKYRLIFNISGTETVKQQKHINDLVSRISGKILKELNLEWTDKMSQLDIKRYWNEVFIPGRLGGRNNSENTISYFLSPFAESFVSQASYRVIPHLGIDSGFQMDMIKSLDPQLASVISDYGYTFDQSLSARYKMRAWLRGIIPLAVQQKRIDRIYQGRSPKVFIDWSKENSYVNTLLEAFRSLELPVDEVEIMKRPDIMPLMLQLGFLQTNPD